MIWEGFFFEIFGFGKSCYNIGNEWIIRDLIAKEPSLCNHVPTGFGFSPKASGFYPFGDATDLAGRAALVLWCG